MWVFCVLLVRENLSVCEADAGGRCCANRALDVGQMDTAQKTRAAKARILVCDPAKDCQGSSLLRDTCFQWKEPGKNVLVGRGRWTEADELL